MTCIVACLDSGTGKICLGGDRRRSSDTSFMDTEDAKVWKLEKHGLVWLLGFTGSSASGQVIKHLVELPNEDLGDSEISPYLIRNWMKPLKESIREAGLMKEKDGIESFDGSLIVCARQTIVVIDDHFSVCTVGMPYTAIGSAEGFAKGALGFAFMHQTLLSTEEKIRSAIAISSQHCQSVGGEIDIIST